MRPARALAALVLAAGCSTSSPTARPTTPAPATPGPASATATPGLVLPSSAVPHECPTPRRTARAWPASFPRDLPWPGGTVTSTNRSDESLSVRLRVPLPMDGARAFVLREWPRAGYTLGGGAATAAELSAPFRRGGDPAGLVRVFRGTEACTTEWVVVVVRRR